MEVSNSIQKINYYLLKRNRYRMVYYLIAIVFLSINFSSCDEKDDVGVCDETFPNPVISFDYIGDTGKVYIPVTNWAKFSDELFEAAPDLEPCGANTNSSRSWVDVYDGDTDDKIYGFCSFGSNENLEDIWFNPGKTEGNVYIIINDRECGKSYKSETIAYGECLKVQPNPRLEYTSASSAGKVYVTVTNWSDYPDNMFRDAPDLPACGANTNASRTWVTFFNANTDTRIYGFCALSENESLEDIWFPTPADGAPVYMILNDRACDVEYKSNTITY